ncbi:MAG TPA: hypothetical protein EYP62_05155 [Kiritimatiellae bacterium]|nr:hypothetical protein [Kiritimatiellia bacterium]
MYRSSYNLITILGLVLAAASTACAGGRPAAAPMVLDGYAARVNDRVITIAEVLAHIQPDIQSLSYEATPELLTRKLAEAFDQGLQRLIERALILEYAEENKQEIPDQVVEQQVARIVRERFSNDRSAFLQALEREHRSLEDWKSEVRDELLAAMVRRAVLEEKMVVTPREIREYYREHVDQFRVPEGVRVAIITIPRKDPRADQEIRAVQQRLQEGEEFAALARESSADAWASRGGDRGWLTPEDFRPEIREVLGDLGPGEVSSPIETPEAVYFAKLIARRRAGIRTLDEVAHSIRTILLRHRREELYRGWISRLRRRYFVEILVNGADLFTSAG